MCVLLKPRILSLSFTKFCFIQKRIKIQFLKFFVDASKRIMEIWPTRSFNVIHGTVIRDVLTCIHVYDLLQPPLKGQLWNLGQLDLLMLSMAR